MDFVTDMSAKRAELTPEKVTEWDAWWKDPFNLRVTGGESMTDLGDRVQAWMDDLPAEGRFAAFTHGGVIRCMTVSYTHLTLPTKRIV